MTKKFSYAETPPVDWRLLKSAFNAAVAALNASEPPQLPTVHFEKEDETDMSLQILDAPITRVLIACKPWFRDAAGLNAGSNRILALLNLLPEFPDELLIDHDHDDESQGEGTLREEVFIVAAEIRLTKKGKIPLAKMIRRVEERATD